MARKFNEIIDWQRRKKDVEVCIDFLFVAVLLVFASWWAYSQFMRTPPYVDTELYPVKGIDISAHNGDVDLQKASDDGVEFVFIKATEGEKFRDRMFRANYAKAKEAGLKTGAYHFFRFDKEGVPQAINLLRMVGARQLELGLVIDIEQHGNPKGIAADTVRQRLQAMVDYLLLMGHRVTFYTNRDGYYEYIAGDYPGYQLWICSFRTNPISAEWTFWQHNHHGRVRGIPGEVDLNVFCGNYEEWEQYLLGDVWPYSVRDDEPALNNN